MDKSGLDATEQQLRSETTVTNQERYSLLIDQLTQIQALSMKVGEHPDKQLLLERIVQVAIELLGGEGGVSVSRLSATGGGGNLY